MGLLHLGGRGRRLVQFATVAALLLIIAASLVISMADSRASPHFPSQLGSMELHKRALRGRLSSPGNRPPTPAVASLLFIAACLVSMADSRGFLHFPSQLGSKELQRPAWRELGDRSSSGSWRLQFHINSTSTCGISYIQLLQPPYPRKKLAGRFKIERMRNKCVSKAFLQSLLLYCHVFMGTDIFSCLACTDSERNALMVFKQSLLDPSNRLASWVDGLDCCKWDGVSCDNQTGYVIQLDLRNPNAKYLFTAVYTVPNPYKDTSLRGRVDPALEDLEHLQHLDLSGNSFDGFPIPDFFGSFHKLRYLNLSSAGFQRIPQHVGNLSNLEVLDLSSSFESPFTMSVDNLEWLSYTCQVVLSQLPYLQELCLTSNDLFDNSSRVFEGKWESIKLFDMSLNLLYGALPMHLGNLRNLEYLDISLRSNNIGVLNVLPNSVCQLKNLRLLALESFNLSGSIPTCFGELSSLEILKQGDNQFNGTLLEVHFQKLSKLQVLKLSSSGLKLGVRPDWVPPFQLLQLFLESCPLERKVFPSWLQTQKSLEFLDLSYSSIVDSIPPWFWNFSPNLIAMRITKNGLYGQLPSPLMTGYTKLLENVDISNKKFTGAIPSDFVNSQISLRFFLASSNRINGTVPEIFGKFTELQYLDLSDNHLIIREIPSGLCDGQHLQLLDLSRKLYQSCCSGFGREPFGWERTQHIGSAARFELPSSMANCTSLKYIDLSMNELTGSIPTWFPESFPDLEILSLRSNKFTGKIPPKLSNLGYLQVLDLAQNNLHGSIPKSFHNYFQAMQKKQELRRLETGDISTNGETFILSANGKLNEYTQILSLVVSMDLSDNLISGEIPAELSDLSGLVHLNLSGNHLSGKIPQDIGNLHELISLDLSRNQLSGPIPSSLSKLSFLQHLNVSYNKLHGMIPSGSQLQTLNDASIYMGNAGLCGPPLSKICAENKTPPSVVHEEKSAKEHNEMLWMYIGIGHGFVVGFCGVFGILAFKRGWRIAFFRFFDDKYA
ncbi:hypothetical protein H6P81_017160 [Aristolochia fimbriata]|uniref:Leucine-rich repeat-containing N-terminal plant-type domain-containing protein n=1 Tax=Aristolochia fimbriata TaxID=158543 RepID=A0AAV7DYR2_ARIFI|nr:hypothetical protein H6P81_017160 [Aristolochia fimbriata]